MSTQRTRPIRRTRRFLLPFLVTPHLAAFAAAAVPSTSDPDGERWSSARPDGHAPIGVMGDHVHGKGEWMVSLRYMHMRMEGMRDGTTSLSSGQVLRPNGEFAVTPLDMDMSMAMAGVMYAPSNSLTLMAMIPYLYNTMDHSTAMGGAFTTTSDGIGDIGLQGLLKFWDGRRQTAHFNLGVSLPTGTITATDNGPAGTPIRLPYPMQIGSGTFDLKPGLTYLGQSESYSWGAQFIQTVRLGENSEGYSFGDRSDATAWGARRLGRDFSASLRLAGAHQGNVQGADPNISQVAMGGPSVPTAIPALQGGNRLDLGLGVNYVVGGGALKGHRFAIELAVPVHQDLNGPQLETDWVVTFGWQLAFGGHH